MTTAVEVISQNDIFNNRICGDPKTIYIIKGNCILNGNVSIPNESVLKFEFDSSDVLNPTRGFISGNGTISGNRIIIEAPKGIQIFGDDIDIQGVANDEISAHWFGAKGDGSTNDSNAIQKALNSSNSAFVVLENLTYKTEHSIVITDKKRLCCKGTISSSANIAIELKGLDVEIDIRELKRHNGYYSMDSDDYAGTGVLFSGNVWNSKISIDNILYFNKALELAPTNSATTEKYIGIQYCKISWINIRAYYGIYFDMVTKMDYVNDTEIRTWINENQFNGGRLNCCFGIFTYKADTNLVADANHKRVGVINGNVFNSIGFEGDVIKKGDPIEPWHFLCKAITLSNASHNNFNDIRLSEGYVDFNTTPPTPWIDLDRCSYLNFSFKSQIPYKAISAQRCNNIKIEAQICDSGLGYISNYDCIHIINSNPAFSPLNSSDDVFNQTHILATRHMVPSIEFNGIYVKKNDNHESNNVENMNLEDLYKVQNGELTTFSDKCFISVCESSTLNISMENDLNQLSFRLPLLMICNVTPGSQIRLNTTTKRCIITESGLYHLRPTYNDNIFEIYAYTYDTATNTPITKVLNHLYIANFE